MKESKRPAWLRSIVWTMALLLIVATLIPILRIERWWVRVFIFPQAQFALLLAIVLAALPFALDLKRTAPKLLLAGVAGALAYQLHYLLPYTPLWAKEARTAEACAAEDRLRLLVLNVKEGNEQPEPVLNLVRDVRPDLFLAVETDSFWARALAPVEGAMPHSVKAPRDTPWGLILYSRLPLVEPEIGYLVEDYVPSIRTRVRLPSGADFDLYGMHPKPPLMHGAQTGDTEVVRAAREIRKRGRPAVLAGDLNDVPWGYAAQHMQEIGGLADPRVGRAFDATFKADNPLLRWPIDHAYVTDAFEVIDFDPLDDVGADHFPLLAELCYRG